MIIVGRPINGICINGDEFLLDDDDQTMEFQSVGQAKDFLRVYGYTDETVLNESFNYYDSKTMEVIE